MSKVAIIIPCYNEEKRLRPDAYVGFLTLRSDADLFFINDGSRDGTASVLAEIANQASERIHIVDLPSNHGKANAVRKGLITALSAGEYNHVGYLDADLSTSLEEFYSLYTSLVNSDADFIFGSRVKMMDTQIERSPVRHLAGRFLATIIDSRLKLGVYDTQCGAKCFKKELAEIFCDQPFKTKWFFDIEIFLRIKRLAPKAKGIEKPLSQWIDRGGSKISILDFPFIIKEIASLFNIS